MNSVDTFLTWQNSVAYTGYMELSVYRFRQIETLSHYIIGYMVQDKTFLISLDLHQ